MGAVREALSEALREPSTEMLASMTKVTMLTRSRCVPEGEAAERTTNELLLLTNVRILGRSLCCNTITLEASRACQTYDRPLLQLQQLL
jgi:hypothetical protein